MLNPGEQWHVARIEEASPDAAGLKTYVRDKLGRPAGIVIETEW